MSGRGGSAGRAAGDLVGPQLAADPDRGLRSATASLGGGAVPVPERWRVQPSFEGGLVPPPGDDQPGAAVVGRLEELEALEAVLVVDGAGPRGEPASELVPAVGWHRDRVNLHDGHALDDASRPGRRAGWPPVSAPRKCGAGYRRAWW